MPKGFWPGRNWTPELLDQLDDLLARGLTDDAIARRLNRTATAVQVARKRHGIASRTSRRQSSRAIAQTMGVDDKAVTRWIRTGRLKGHRGQRRGSYRQWVVDEESLFAFLEHPGYWHLWDPSRITDRALREWAMEERKERYLTQAEVARRYYVLPRTVGAWCDRGQLPFARRGNRFIPESALVGFVPPHARSKKGTSHRRWTDVEDAYLLRARPAGSTFASLAMSLERTVGSVANRWYRLESAPALDVAS